MSLSTLEAGAGEDYETVGLFPLNAYHLRVLCESPMNGGGGLSPNEVGDLSVDQLWFLLCDIENLKKECAGSLTISSPSPGSFSTALPRRLKVSSRRSRLGYMRA